MASIIPEYHFDVFISYRHNEAILEWVKEFSSKLQQELDTTLKEKLSIYYYNIEAEGNLAYQEMEQAIQEKLKSVIFIPIISTGYCDTNKDAWQKEFMAFKQMSYGDDIGLNLQAENGNQLSRILPVRINQVDHSDIKQIENEIGGFIRSIDFIYEGMEGANRPLRSRDDEVLARKSSTLYRNQINKTANEISKTIRQAKGKLGIEVSEQPQTSTQEIEHTKTTLTPSSNGNISKPTVFLGWTAEDCVGKRDELALILQKAGMNVVPNIDCPLEEQGFKDQVEQALNNSVCSVHLMGGKVGRKLDNDGSPLTMYQINQAKVKVEAGGYKMFIWQLPPNYFDELEPDQHQCINDIRNNIVSNMIFTNVISPMQLVDDIRTSMIVEEKPVLATEDTEVFFINNQLDEEEANEVTGMLTDVVDVKSLNISQDQDLDYGEMAVQQIKRSKLAVIYFREASEWALPFAQQIWKMVGGASSNTPLLLIGDEDIDGNAQRLFNAPKVISKIVSSDLIALEVKATYDKAVEGII